VLARADDVIESDNARMSPFGPSRQFAAKQRFGRFGREADIKWQAGPAGKVANDPTETWRLTSTRFYRGEATAADLSAALSKLTCGLVAIDHD